MHWRLSNHEQLATVTVLCVACKLLLHCK